MKARIKKIMQKNAEVGRIAMAVPVIISRAVEMFLKSLLTKTCLITDQSNVSGVVSVAHVKRCIESEKLFHFLKDVTTRFTFPPQQDKRGLSLWPSCVTKRPDACVQNKEKVEEVTRSLDSLGNDFSSSVNKSRSNSSLSSLINLLVILLINQIKKQTNRFSFPSVKSKTNFKLTIQKMHKLYWLKWAIMFFKINANVFNFISTFMKNCKSDIHYLRN
ncbi:uncharacterized protein LOC144032023 isoform X2 [Festucalex cinctus]